MIQPCAHSLRIPPSIGLLVFLTALIGVLGSACQQTPNGASAGSERTGAEIYETCLVCHSTREMQRGPILSGLPEWYVTLQLEKFRLGIRGRNPTNRSEYLMGAGQSILTNSIEIVRVSRHIAREAAPVHLRTVRGNTERGKLIYTGCIPCHGERGQGVPSVKGSPLDILEDWYLLDQMRRFKRGERGIHPGDVEGQAMLPVAQALEEQDFRDVVAYIAHAFGRTSSP